MKDSDVEGPRMKESEVEEHGVKGSEVERPGLNMFQSEGIRIGGTDVETSEIV